MITKKGYDIVSEEQYFKNIMKELKTEFPNMSEHPSNLLTVLVRLMAKNENRRDYDRAECYSNAYIATATGLALGKAVRLAGISRYAGTRAVGNVKIAKDTAVRQLIIPKNMPVKSDGMLYQTTNDSALIIETDEHTIQIESIGVGYDHNIPTGSKLNTVNNVRGVKKIETIEEIAGGTDIESDSVLRKRYLDRMNAHANSSLKGIMDEVKRVPETYMVSGEENWTDAERNGLLPHSFIIYVAGGADQRIAEAIMRSKPAGIQTNGQVNATVTVSGKPYVIKFSRYTDQTIYIRAEVAIERSIAPSNFEDLVKDGIIEFVTQRNKIVAYELNNHISQSIDAVKGVRHMYMGFNPNPTSSDDITAPAGTNFVCERPNIELVVI